MGALQMRDEALSAEEQARQKAAQQREEQRRLQEEQQVMVKLQHEQRRRERESDIQFGQNHLQRLQAEDDAFLERAQAELAQLQNAFPNAVPMQRAIAQATKERVKPQVPDEEEQWQRAPGNPYPGRTSAALVLAMAECPY